MDVLLVVLDDLWVGDVTPTLMPNLIAFGGTARIFTRCYSMPVCSQSRACLTYGRYGRTLGIIGGMDSNAGPEPLSGLSTLAGELRAAGYATALIGKWHGGRNPFEPTRTPPYDGAPFARGFSSWLAGTPDNVDDFYAWPRVDQIGDQPIELTNETTYATAAHVVAAADWWESHEGNPRFMQVSLNAPHGPYHFPPADELGGFVSTASSLNRRMYESEIRSADWAINELVTTVGPDTVVVVVGDNGTPNNARAPGQQANKVKATCYEGGVRVPLAIRSPSYQAGMSDRLCHIVDIPATLMVAAGLAVPPDWDGRSLTLTARPTALSEAQDGASGGGHLVRAAMTGRYKLLRTDDDPEEFYDLQLDPSELSPVPPQQQDPSILAALRGILYG